MNAYGGEDRFWLGPEGGQFSLFFAPGAPQDLAHWQTPAPIDAEPFTLADRAEDRALLRKTMRLTNASGTVFDLDVEREVQLYTTERTWSRGGRRPERSRRRVVGFESRNRITNRGTARWPHDTGLVSIWIAGTFPPSPSTIIVLPFRPGTEGELGPVVNDNYFGRGAVRSVGGQGERDLFSRRRPAARQDRRVTTARAPVLGSYDARTPAC